MQTALEVSQISTSQVSTSRYVAELQRALNDLPHQAIERLVALLVQAAHEGRTVFLVGNGGSAATASHFACDLGKGTRTPQKPYSRVIALTDNAPLITAWANDVAYEDVFAEQLRGLCGPNDILIAISASGRSANILRVADAAREVGATVVALTGGGGLLGLGADIWIETPAGCIEQIEDLHLIVQHLVCRQVRERV
jgi:D-sedoheptulose 7-phosphate isomerase